MALMVWANLTSIALFVVVEDPREPAACAIRVAGPAERGWCGNTADGAADTDAELRLQAAAEPSREGRIAVNRETMKLRAHTSPHGGNTDS